MDIDQFRQQFLLFNTSSSTTLKAILSIACKQEYPAGRAVLIENAWGNGVYFIVQGWIKVRRFLPAEGDATLAVLGPGEFFGEMAVLDEAPRSTDVVALSKVELLSVPAQKFTQLLIKDTQLQYRLLQLMVKRVRQANSRFELQRQPTTVRLASTLLALAEKVDRGSSSRGQDSTSGVTIFNLSIRDLADITDISPDETQKIMTTLTNKGWIKSDPASNQLHLLKLQDLKLMAGQHS
jgi:CRP/FNR family transcriptional regulator, cyclic AMP receptor protein